MFKVFNDPVKIVGKPKIDARKSDYVKPGGNIRVNISSLIIFLHPQKNKI